MSDTGSSGRRPGLVRRGTELVASLAPIEIMLLLAAPAALPAAALGLRLFGLKRMLGWLDGSRSSLADRVSGDEHAAARRLTRIVGAAVTYGPWPANCLQRSTVLWWYLRVHRIEADLRIGVRRDPSGSGLAFHAWVEHGGEVLNDSPAVRTTYATFDRPIAPVTAHFN